MCVAAGVKGIRFVALTRKLTPSVRVVKCARPGASVDLRYSLYDDYDVIHGSV